MANKRVKFYLILFYSSKPNTERLLAVVSRNFMLKACASIRVGDSGIHCLKIIAALIFLSTFA